MMNCVFVFLKLSVNAQKNDTAGLAAANAVPPAPSRWHKCPQPPGKGLNAPAEPRSSREKQQRGEEPLSSQGEFGRRAGVG